MAESSGIIESPTPNHSFLMPSACSTPISDSLGTPNYPHIPNSTPSRRARRSPGHQLLRQVSDSRILGLKSPNTNSISEGRPSFVLSTCSNDLATGSHGGSSDGWSMRTFSELVASSQRERWSFDSEHIGSINGRIGESSSSRFSCSPSTDVQYCGACSKVLAERSSWGGPELSVVSVLVCGHIYHAECLESMTREADKYDPMCPICMVGEKQFSKISRRAWKAEMELKSKSRKISKNRVVDSYLDSDFEVFDAKNTDRKGKCVRMEPSSSTKSSSTKPFLKRHFSLGPKWSRSMSENDSSKKKGFWARCRKD